MRLLSFIILSLIASPAAANNWWLVYAEGEKPDRQAYYVDQDHMNIRNDPSRLITTDLSVKLTAEDLIDYIEINGETIFESKNQPAKINMIYRVKCKENLISSNFTQALWRHDKVETLKDMGWTAVASNIVYFQIHSFVCDNKGRNSSAGFVNVTNNQLSPMNITWQRFWSDSVEPKWTTTKTREESIAAANAALASARATIDSMIGTAGGKLQQIETDRDSTILEQRALFAKMRNKATPLLQSWVGLSERDLVASWGNPASFHDEGSARFLNYAYGYTTSIVDEYGNSTPSETWQCNLTFEVRDGIIADYRSSGNYCRTAAENLPRGRQ
ncbi:MAG: hypothetical protein ABL918_09145 [Chakrabartia sp.]